MQSSVSVMDRYIDESIVKNKVSRSNIQEAPDIVTFDNPDHALEGERIRHYNNSMVFSWENSLDVVHVIYSRFMQHQPNLLELGKARLELFKTFCLPTIAQQTNQHFLWIIRTDPDLHPTLRHDLTEALDGMPNAVVVGSTLGRDGILNGGFREESAMDEFNSEAMFYGDVKLIKSFHAAAKDRTLLETNLDTDDGFALPFVENAQAITAKRFERDQDKEGWLNLCLGPYFEWHFHAPWAKHSDTGCLLEGLTRTCVKSGMSWATQPNAKPNFKSAPPHLLKEKSPSCTRNRTVDNYLFHGCWEEVPREHQEGDVLAIHAMTPASMGVARGVISIGDWSIDSLTYDKKAWTLLEPFFAMRVESVKDVHKFITDNMEDIVEDRERSKCTHDHTCIGKWRNDYKVVHLLHTFVQDANVVELMRRVSFASLMGGQTYQYLWIVRIKDFPDHRLIKALLEDFVKSPLNIILVKSDHGPHVNFRDRRTLADFTNETVIFGDLTILKDYHSASQDRPLLETFISPTEGLARYFFPAIQNSTVTYIKQNRVQEGPSSWFYQCLPEYLEFDYFTPRGKAKENGFYAIRGSDRKCVDRPGSTRVSLPGAQNDRARSDSKACSSIIKNGCYILESHGNDEALRTLHVVPPKEHKSRDFSEQEILDFENREAEVKKMWWATFAVVPMRLKKLKKATAELDRKTVHVIHTSLQETSLIDVWSHFSVDSLQRQTEKLFLWIVRVNNVSEKQMHDILYPFSSNHEKGHINVIVAKSNYTPTVDFRSPDAIADINQNSLLYGDMDMLMDYHMAAGGRTLIETFLQPTEGVASTFVERLQNDTLHLLGGNQVEDGPNAWLYRCAKGYIEWNYFTPRGDDANNGFLKIVDPDEIQCPGGPGTIRISLPSSKVPDQSRASSAIECSSRPSERINGCVIPAKFLQGQIVRAVIPETLQSPVLEQLSQSELQKLDRKNKRLSSKLNDVFKISPYSVEIVRTNILKRLCSHGRECNFGWDSKHGVVHVVQTSLQDPSMFQIWRHFCFALESQTTNKFLWILRIGSDPELKKLVLKPIQKTRLNIVVVDSTATAEVDFRSPTAIADITKKSLIHGKMDVLQHYHEKAQTFPLLETFLEPTEAVTKTFFEDLQNLTATNLRMDFLQENSFYYMCPSKYIEWTYFTPHGKERQGGFLKGLGEDDTCVNKPGLTRISLPKAKFPNNLVGSGTPECQLKKGGLKTGCFLPIDSEEIQSARVIVPSSIEQPMVLSVEQGELERLTNEEPGLESILKKGFNIWPQSLKLIQKAIKENLQDAKDGRF